MKTSTERLVDILIEAQAPQEMIDRAWAGRYDQERTPIEQVPIKTLVDDACKNGLKIFAIRVADGYYDAVWNPIPGEVQAEQEALAKGEQAGEAFHRDCSALFEDMSGEQYRAFGRTLARQQYSENVKLEGDFLRGWLSIKK